MPRKIQKNSTVLLASRPEGSNHDLGRLSCKGVTKAREKFLNVWRLASLEYYSGRKRREILVPSWTRLIFCFLKICQVLAVKLLNMMLVKF